jgi:cell wall-associated NlpC family hydrolase
MRLTSIIRTSTRTAVRAGALAVAATALPFTGAQAAPAVTAPTSVAPVLANRTRQADIIADLAVSALAALRNIETNDSAAATPAAGSAAAAGDYLDKRNEVAVAVAERLAIDPERMIAAWERADLEHQEALLAGLTQVGVPYRKNTSKEGVGFDCSGLTTYAWGQAGFDLTRQSSAQIRAAAPRTPETAQAGDLVQYPGHVSMWLGVDLAMVHSPYPGKNVEVHHAKKRSLKYGDPTETI